MEARSFDPDAAMQWLQLRRQQIVEDLSRYIAIDTSLGKEGAANSFLLEYLSGAGFTVQMEPLHPDLKGHWAASPHPLSRISEERVNLRCVFNRGGSSGLRTAFNCHIDVVPATQEFENAFCPVLVNDRLYGRGACDTKNNLVMLAEALRYISEADLKLSRNVSLDMTVDEEVGGNGTLSTILHGVPSDEVVVLEPTDLRIFRGHRGCLTFEVVVHGRAAHMGSPAAGCSAIKGATRIISELELLEKELIEESRDDPDFGFWDFPLQLNIGVIDGGEWAGSVAQQCKVLGNLGFLPPSTIEDMESLIRSRIFRALDKLPLLKADISFNSGLRNGAYIQGNESRLLRDLGTAVEAAGLDPTALGWKVSCDAHYYDRLLRIPVVMFGSGSLGAAHSANENVLIEDVLRGALVLVDFLTRSS